MTASNFSVTDSQRTQDFAQPYVQAGKSVKKVPFFLDDVMGPAGSINSSVADMANWLLLHLAGGKWKGKPLIEPKNLQQMHSPQVVVPGGESEHIQHTSYGLGWDILSYRGHKLIKHGGGIDGFSSEVGLLPARKLGIVVLSNLDGNPVPRFIETYVYDRVLGLEPIPWDRRAKLNERKLKFHLAKTKRMQAKARKKGTKPSHPLHDFVGSFDHPAYGVLSIQVKNGRLHATRDTLTWRLDHYHYDQFQGILATDKTDIVPFSFLTGPGGKIPSVSVKLENAVDPIVFKRMPPKKDESPKAK
jgi:hypothetical protein